MTPIRIEFPGSLGNTLAARLDLPAGPPLAYALFAHCFTCSKDVHAASRIASGLTARGLAVLRFDFTGLGSSDGEFANTDFSSNVADLEAASAWLRRHHRAPQLLVGHSLGGAAVISAAHKIPEVRAVATIGTPASTTHLTKLFADQLDEIEKTGRATVCIADRPFTITKSFVENLAQHTVVNQAKTLHRPLLVLHSPIDEFVGIDNAAQIFQAARHPKSFVSLDGADHLLTDPADAQFAADVIAAWAMRYMDPETPAQQPPRATAQVVVGETGQGPFLNHVVIGQHRMLADEPVSVGGFDAGPAPYDLVAAGLGACTSMTIRMYANRKSLPLDRVIVEVTHAKVDAVDAGSGSGSGSGSGAQNSASAKVDQFDRNIALEGNLTDEQRRSLVDIAGRCPVHRTLEARARIVTREI